MKVILASSWHRLRQKQHMCEIRSSQSSLPCLFSMPLFLLTHQSFTPCDLISWNFCQCCQHASDSAYKTQEFPQWLSGKDTSCKFRRCRSKRSIPGSGRSPGIGNGNPLQYSCLENSTDRGALRVILHGVAESRTWLNNSAHAHTRTHMHAHMHTHTCTHTCTCTHAHTHTCTCTCTHACPRTHTHTCTYACTHARPHTHMHTYTCTHTRTHTHTHTHKIPLLKPLLPAAIVSIHMFVTQHQHQSPLQFLAPLGCVSPQHISSASSMPPSAVQQPLLSLS